MYILVIYWNQETDSFLASYSLPSHALSRGTADTLNDTWTWSHSSSWLHEYKNCEMKVHYWVGTPDSKLKLLTFLHVCIMLTVSFSISETVNTSYTKILTLYGHLQYPPDNSFNYKTDILQKS